MRGQTEAVPHRRLPSSAETRSRIMAAVRSRDTGPEMVLRRALHAKGLRYRLHVRSLPGRPDVCLPKWHAVLLVHGCFWHRHEGCSKATMPKSNLAFWSEKFRRNVARDRSNVDALVRQGWRVGIVWQCWIGKALDDAKVSQVVAFLSDGKVSRAEWPSPKSRTTRAPPVG